MSGELSMEIILLVLFFFFSKILTGILYLIVEETKTDPIITQVIKIFGRLLHKKESHFIFSPVIIKLYKPHY